MWRIRIFGLRSYCTVLSSDTDLDPELHITIPMAIRTTLGLSVMPKKIGKLEAGHSDGHLHSSVICLKSPESPVALHIAQHVLSPLGGEVLFYLLSLYS